jgi:hypothetical protein
MMETTYTEIARIVLYAADFIFAGAVLGRSAYVCGADESPCIGK